MDRLLDSETANTRETMQIFIITEFLIKHFDLINSFESVNAPNFTRVFSLLASERKPIYPSQPNQTLNRIL